MAKKTKKVEVEEPQIQEEVVVETAPVVEQPKARERIKPQNEWEIKDRVYHLGISYQICRNRKIHV